MTMGKKSQLRLPAELVAWRDHTGSLNVGVEANLEGKQSWGVGLGASDVARIEQMYQRQNPTDVVFQAIQHTIADDDQGITHKIQQNDGFLDEVRLSGGRDYPAFLLTAERKVPPRTPMHELPAWMTGEETDLLQITARLKIEDRFIVLTKLTVDTFYAQHGCWVIGYTTSDEGGSQDGSPLHSEYTGTVVPQLLSSLYEGVSELGEQYDLWPGYTVVLDGSPEDDARRKSYRAESFSTPLGEVSITHESGVVAFAFRDFDFDDERLVASAWMRRSDQSAEAIPQALLEMDRSMVFTSSGAHGSPWAFARAYGVFARVAQHVLDTDPDWYGLSLRTQDRS